jgi:hypothetical protein
MFKEINSQSIKRSFAKKPQKIVAISKNIQHTKMHKNEVQNNTRKYDFTMHIFTQFSPCTGPLINNVNILRNLHLFREYIHNSHCNNKNPSSWGETHPVSLTDQTYLPFGSQCAQNIVSMPRGLRHPKSCYWLKTRSVRPRIFRQGSTFRAKFILLLCVDTKFCPPSLTKNINFV